MKIIRKDVISSTNEFIKEQYESLDNYTVVTAKYQTSGRGRMTRIWESNDSDNILMSLLIKEFKERTDLNLLSLVSSMSVHKFLSKYINNLYVKWPNDILVDNKKICGILLEGKMNDNSKMIVIGIGININQTTFNEDINHLTTSLKKELNKDFDINLLTLELAEILVNDIEEFLNGSNIFLDYIKSNLYGINKQIEYTRNNTLCEGTILDIHTDGRLIVKESDQILYINSGEIKIKR